MKKTNFVIIGFLVGIIVSVLMIHDNKNLAYGEESESDFANGMYSVSMSDIFSAAGFPGEDLYDFVRSSVAYKPAEKALDVLAESYSLSRDEANNVLSGSPTPFLSGGNGPSFSLADATAMTEKFIADYEMLYDIYDLQQEIEIEVGASEIFSNGDLADSGFDLIVDLSNIEVVIFGAESETTMGSDFEDEMGEPFTINLITDLIPELIDDDEDSDSKLFFDDDGAAQIDVGGEKQDVPTLEDDVCPEANIYKDAIAQNEAAEALEDPDDPTDPTDPASPITTLPLIPGGLNVPSEIPEVPPDDYDKVFCIGIDEPEQKTGADALPGGEVKSSGGGSGSWLQAGESGSAEDAIFTINASICFDIEFIYEKYSSKNVGDSCILCYVKKINEEMDKVVSGSLLPSKTTGSMLESGKCKETGTSIAIAVVGVPVPVPTPVNDDIVFGKNIFEEWNKFVDSVNVFPFNSSSTVELSPASPSVPPSAADNAAETCEGATNQLTLFNCITNTLNEATAEIKNSVTTYNQSSAIENALLFTDKLKLELKQMKSFFDNFKNTYKNDDDGTDSIIEVLDELNKKEVKS